MKRINGFHFLLILITVVLLISACKIQVSTLDTDLTPGAKTSSPTNVVTSTPNTIANETPTNLSTSTRYVGTTKSKAVPDQGTVMANLVTIAISQNSYNIGDQIKFNIINDTENPIYYTYGCSWPVIFKVEEEKLTPLTVNILEYVPEISELMSKKTDICFWDQKAWQDPNRTGSSRFQHYSKLLQVPPGRYLLKLDYYFEASDAFSLENAETVYSQEFTIK